MSGSKLSRERSSFKVLPRSEEIIADKVTGKPSRSPASVKGEKVYDKSIKEWTPRDENEADFFYHGDL